ncbi:MAG: DUF1015 domain-containing protein [Candidatus Omnitrophica bacterium]|nr:DUF1015 domain-containing protein [Candidatus Omnitrophota bacterium]
MVALHPFRALRYDPQRVTDLSTVIAPPYDVIDADRQEQLYQASPYNVVRLILGKPFAGDTERDNRYTRARREFDSWMQQGILRRDAAEALYLIEQTFTDGGRAQSRVGFIALLTLGDAIERAVYRHEATLAAPKADRSKLFEAIPANLEPIFCVYPDTQGAIQTRLRQWSRQTPPTVQATLNGEGIRLWVITDAQAVDGVAQELSSTAVLIADGHHRFEVAYAHRQRYGAVMSYFVSMEEPALVVRPIHRVVHHHLPVTAEGLGRLCRVEGVPDLAPLLRWLQDGKGDAGRFGFYDGRALCRVSVHPEQLTRWLMAPPVPLPLAALDVSLLHGLLFPQLGIPPTPPSTVREAEALEIRYTAEASEALEAVDRGEGRCAWLLRGIPLTQVYALAAQGLSLPPKSTYFYPKIPSGLALNLFAEP